jgi:hypothetical protein
MSSISLTAADGNEQKQATTERCDESSDATQAMASFSSVVSSTTPILSGEILTENDHEDNLMTLIDELIHNFLSRTNRRSHYRSLFRWTFDDGSNLSYSVVVKIVEPSPMI